MAWASLESGLGRREVSRRCLLKLATIAGTGVGVAHLLAACSSSSATPTAAPTSPPSAPATVAPTQAAASAPLAPTATPLPVATAQPAVTAAPVATSAATNLAKEQTLRFAQAVKLLTFDPAQESGYGRFIISLVFMPPFLLDDKMQLTPGTCTSYDRSPDGMTYTLHVDPKVKWSDGSKFTANDIKAWIEYCSSPRNPGPYKSEARNVAGYDAVNAGSAKDMSGLTVPDDQTLKIQLAKKDPLFHYTVLANYRFGGPKADFATQDPKSWWTKNPAVTGPFKIEKFDADAVVYNFAPNENYWRELKPTLQHVQVVTVADAQTIQVMWQNNQIDAMFLFGLDAINVEQKYPESIVPMPNYGGNFFWTFNFTKEPTNDINVRKALKHAIDVNTIAQTQYLGKRKVAKGPISPYAPGNRWDTIDKSNDFFKYDPQLAKQELAASKYGSVDNLPSIALTPNAATGDKVLATEMVLEMWRKNLGITKVESRPLATDYGNDFTKTINFLRISSGGLPDAATQLLNMCHSTTALATTYSGGYKNPQIDALIDKAYVMDRDDPNYIPTSQQAEDLYLADYMYVPLYVDQYSYYVKPWVKNLKANWNNLMYTLDQVYLENH
jgi:peptide/nickel transport system substrate-binding protein